MGRNWKMREQPVEIQFLETTDVFLHFPVFSAVPLSLSQITYSTCPIALADNLFANRIFLLTRFGYLLYSIRFEKAVRKSQAEVT